ncbi:MULTISPECIES: hybrid sensor histidine kinase/response regulator [Giesbergeria]|uniref:histidine kinase n=1 Tax=Giesbergeria sinuosa TaxID=80883 RepID=A0ABV9QEA8_9BURK
MTVATEAKPAPTSWLERWRSSATGQDRDEVVAEQVVLLRRSFPMTLWASLLTSLGTVWVMSLVAPLQAMLWWMASHVLVVASVYLYLRPLPRSRQHPGADVWRLVVCMAAMGLTWGSLGITVWYLSGSTEGVVYAIGILSTVSSGALGLGAPLLRAYIVYLSCAVGGILLALVLAEGPVTLPATVLVAVYYGLTCLHARNLGQAARDSIEIKFDNERLVMQLRAQTQRALEAQEAAEHANQDKSRFLAAASHDLRQPLHAMGLFLETLRRSPLNDHQSLVLGHARTASRAAAEMLTTLLDYSRLEAGVVKAHRAPFSVQALLSALEQEFGGQADAASLVYRTRETSAAALADRALVDLVMRNLISNALRYTPKGGVLIACRQRRMRLALEVWDTGVGIPKEQIGEIFREFHQLGNPERDRRKGLGLGLAIVKRLVAEMGTQVEVFSCVGRGSVFRLWLDAWHGPLLMDEHADSGDQTRRLVGLRVLAIDDDEAVCLGMQSLFQSWGCLCTTAPSAHAVLESPAALRRPPELIITDYRLRQGETGKDVLEQLRNHWGQPVPAIIMTGDTSPQRLRDAQSTAALLLHKPVSSDQLIAAMVQLLPTPER